MIKKHRDAPSLAIIRDILQDNDIRGVDTLPDNNIKYFAGFNKITIVIQPQQIIIKTTWDSTQEG